MNARKKTEKWNAGVKEQLKAISQVTTHGADFQAVLKFTKFRAAHWEARCGKSIQSPSGLVCVRTWNVGSSVHSPTFQSVERLAGGRESNTHDGVRSRALDDPEKDIRQLQRRERTRRAHGVLSQYRYMSSERHTFTKNRCVDSRGSRYKSAIGALRIQQSMER
jgi:hypothetical protein